MSILIEGFCAFATPVVGSGGSITLDLDRTLVLQMVLFMLLVVVLKPLLFDPVLRVFEQREQRTEGARAEARAMQERAGDLLREYDREVDGMRQTAAEERDRLRHETSRLEADILRKARDDSNRILEEGRKRIQDEVRSLETELLSRTSELATEITSSILGRRAQ
jgi:F-type H+-transporting ATPase subunit b